MSEKLHPGLLRACAAYLAHVGAYVAWPDGPLTLLRADARSSKPSTLVDPPPWPPPPARAVPAVFRHPPRPRTDAECDELVSAHIRAIRAHSPEPNAIARAILDATPAMLAWWCDMLAEASR